MELSFDPNTVTVKSGHFINGRIVRVAGDEIAVVRPSDGQTYAHCPIADAEMINRAVMTAKHAFRTSGWATRPPRERGHIIHRWADLVEENAQGLA